MNLQNYLDVKEEQLLTREKFMDEFQKRRTERISLKTGISSLDDVLGGGFVPGNVYVVFGGHSTGKTQLCHQISVKSVEKSKIVYYLDTEGTFRAERIREIAIARSINANSILKDIYVSKILSNATLLQVLKDIEELTRYKHQNILIVDSINNYYRYEQGNENITFNSARNNFMQVLKKLAEITKASELITIITAQVTSNFSDDPIIREVPVGNQYLNYYFSEYLYLGIIKEELRFAHLINSNFLQEGKVSYKITPAGLVDQR